MIKLIISGSVIIKNMNDFLTGRVKKDLTFKNPDYEKRIKCGKYIPATCHPTIELWRQIGPNIMVPRGYLQRLIFLIGSKPYSCIDNTVKPYLDINFIGTPRAYGIKALNDCMKHRYGILEAGTGAGKTVMAIHNICERKTTALILVHSKELLEQWIERLKQFTDLGTVGTIGGGKKKNIQPVTVAIINSAHKIANEIKEMFGIIICDECHRAMSPMWVKTTNTMRPRYQLGLSATPFRSDGLTAALYKVIGPKLHKVDPKMLVATGAVLAPKVIRVNTPFSMYFDRKKSNYSKMLSILTCDIERNTGIVQTIIKDIKKYNQPIMVVSDRVAHCDMLFNLIELSETKEARPVLVHGKQDHVMRKTNIEKVRNGKANILIATATLLGEGFDAPNLSAVFLCTPMKFSGRVIQTIGRILRPEDNKIPRVYDFRDNKVEVLRFSGFARDRVYKEKGWTI